MHGVLREYKIRPGSRERVIAGVREHLVPRLQKLPGFGGYTLAFPSEETFFSFGLWETRAGAEDATKVAAEVVSSMLAEHVLGEPRIMFGQVSMREERRGVVPRYGVMRRFKFTPQQIEETRKIVRSGLIPLLLTSPGFAAYTALDCGDGQIVSLTGFESKEYAEVGGQRALTWAQHALPNIHPIEVISADLPLRVLASDLIPSV